MCRTCAPRWHSRRNRRKRNSLFDGPGAGSDFLKSSSASPGSTAVHQPLISSLASLARASRGENRWSRRSARHPARSERLRTSRDQMTNGAACPIELRVRYTWWRSSRIAKMSEPPLKALLDRTNLVHPTELGCPLLELFFRRLQERDRAWRRSIAETKELSNLQCHIDGSSTLAACITTIREASHFARYLRKATVMVVQVRNRVPADISIVYRHNDDAFWLESMFSVSHTDPSWRIVTDARLIPAAWLTGTESDPPRRSFGLHELADLSQLLESHTYRVIFDDLRVTWFAVVLDRDEDFTWVMYFWYRLPADEPADHAVQRLRAGFDHIASALGKRFRKARMQWEGYRIDDSLTRGLLVFTNNFATLWRQNYAAESMLQGLVDPGQTPPLRQAIYARLKQEHERRIAVSDSLTWLVDPCFHPTSHEHAAALRVTVRTYGSTSENEQSGQHEVSLTELHLPHLPRLHGWWDLEPCDKSGLSKVLTELGARNRAAPDRIPDAENLSQSLAGHLPPPARFLPFINAIVRPVWDVDVIANRLSRYQTAPQGKEWKQGRSELRERFKQERLWKFVDGRSQEILGVLQAI